MTEAAGHASGTSDDVALGVVSPASGTAVSPSVSAALESVGLGVYVLDRDGLLVSFDDPLNLLLPAGVAPLIGRSLWQADPSLGVSEAGAALRAALDGRVTAIRRPLEGVDRWIELSAVFRVGETAVCCRDVTADHVMADQLADRTRRLHRKAALLDAAKEAIFIREMDDSISYWNLGAASLYGRPAATALGSSARTTLQAETEEYDAATAALLRDGEWSGELTQNASDGRGWVADCRWQLSRDDKGEPSFVLCVVTDVTDAKRERDVMFRAQRMDSLGALAGGMAHDLNNVLTPILLATQLLESEETDPMKQSLLESIGTSAQRGAEMIRQVTTFARGEESRRRLLDVGDLLDQVTTFCAEVLPKSITVTTHVAHRIPKVLGDKTQLLQILMNFVTNARDAMPLGGRLSIIARATAEGEGDEDAAPSVLISVQDTGTGMSEQTVAHVFDPFFTTKAVGDGTGLGLSTSIAIARGHGGELTVRSALGEGSKFFLRLPAVPADAPAQQEDDARPAAAIARGRGERVLVVDDESTIRAIVQHTLEANGYVTIPAGDGMEAITLLESEEEPIDLVLTDMMMPVMDGAAVAAYLFEHHPAIPLIAASGVTTTEESVRAAHLGVEYFLTKPFSTDELLRAVRGALDAGATSAVVQSAAPPEIERLREQEQEQERLAAVRDLHLLDTPPERRFDQITELARKIFGVPVAQITLVDEYDHFTKSGLSEGDPSYTSRRDSLCAVTITTPEILIVEDASEDSRFSSKETVVGPRQIRFYAGRPLTVAGGHPVGALCLIDTVPRELTVHERQLLDEMGDWVERELRLSDGMSHRIDVQQTLIPVDLLGRKEFDVAGVRHPVSTSSGSFYDWTDHDDPFTFTIAEVVGAGDGAALIAATIRAAFQARRHLEPAEAAHSVNQQLMADLTASDSSASIFHGRFHPASGRLDYVDAGHGLTVLVRASGDLEPLAPTGLPLGVARNGGWVLQTAHLDAGDALITASVGLFTLFAGNEWLADIAGLAAAGSAHGIIDRISTVVETGPPSDDVTVIAITRPRGIAP